jgi:hypothetical protein
VRLSTAAVTWCPIQRELECFAAKSGIHRGLGIGTRLRSFTKYEVLLLIIFVLTLPLSNPWVRGDGVGYYAFARSILIEHRLDFTKDWLAANTSFRMDRTDAYGNILPGEYTSTGHLDNHFSVGPAILWFPFLLVAHGSVLLWDHLGGKTPADGFSKPYCVAMALGTAVYGFLSLMISFALARRYVPERWAFLATLGIWFASSLPVYMYFNPSWSHAHSAFMVALFLWYWIRTRPARTWLQWIVLGAIGGLMMDVYYVSGVLLLLPFLESLVGYWEGARGSASESNIRLFLKDAVCAAIIFAFFVPTLISKKIIYGSYMNFGYRERWFWSSPAFFKASFSSDHGLFSWTPILVLAVAGLFILRRRDRSLAWYLIALFSVYLYAIGCYQNWDGLSSFGNRFFVSLSSVFVIGLAAFFDSLERAWTERRAAFISASATAVLTLWNLGLIFQWGTHLIPARGPISWRDAAYNQFVVVPVESSRAVKSYLTGRRQLMDRIEQEDVDQLKTRRTE